MRARDLQQLAQTLGLDVVGAAPAAPYLETERHIRERSARGLFADMKFTMARPEESCHPETLLPGARTVVSAALCYYAPEPERPPGYGRLPRYTWHDAYAELREKLDALGRELDGAYRVLVDANQHVDREAAARSGVGFYGKQSRRQDYLEKARKQAKKGEKLDELGPRLGGSYRVLVDENQHVDREAAARSGVGFYGKNTMLITRTHGSWVVLGTLITDIEIEPPPPLDLDCGSCRLCIDACPTGALDEPGVLDATRCLSYWTQAAASIPEEYRAHLGAQVYGCDICQDVCPWNRGVEKRRADESVPDDVEPHVSLPDWLTADADELRRRYDRLFVPQNDGRWLKRNALIAAGNVGGEVERAEVERYRDSDDEMLREHAAWALSQFGQRSGG